MTGGTGEGHDVEVRFASPPRLLAAWTQAIATWKRMRLEARAARVKKARGVLFRDGTMRRVARVRRAVKTPDFHDRFMSRDRSGLADATALEALILSVLDEMGVDTTDVQVTLRRSADGEMKLRPLPTLAAASRALAVVDAGQAPVGVPVDPLDVVEGALSAPLFGGMQDEQGTSAR